VRVHSLLFSSLLSSLLFAASPALAQCRDARGEPGPCTLPMETPLSAPTPVVPIDGDVPTEPNELGHQHRERETGYVEFAADLSMVDTRQLHFSPMTPSAVAEIARGGVATGVGTNFETALGGFSLTLGARPVPWIRLPQLRLSAGFGDLAGASADLVGGAQPLHATFHDLYYLRAELGGGLDLDFDPVRIYALAHIAIAGYFATATVEHAGLGDLGTDTFAEDAWEAGWTVGMEVELDPNIAYSFGYRHVHTGVESNSFFFGVNGRFD
jgi:hypothetical protein